LSSAQAMCEVFKHSKIIINFSQTYHLTLVFGGAKNLSLNRWFLSNMKMRLSFREYPKLKSQNNRLDQ